MANQMYGAGSQDPQSMQHWGPFVRDRHMSPEEAARLRALQVYEDIVRAAPNDWRDRTTLEDFFTSQKATIAPMNDLMDWLLAQTKMLAAAYQNDPVRLNMHLDVLRLGFESLRKEGAATIQSYRAEAGMAINTTSMKAPK